MRFLILSILFILLIDVVFVSSVANELLQF